MKLMIEIFKIKDAENLDSEKRYVRLSSNEDSFVVNELSLGGHIIGESRPVQKDNLELISNPSAPWKAAFMVWKNSVVLNEIEDEQFIKKERYRNKLIELLAQKHNIDPTILLQIIKELDDLE